MILSDITIKSLLANNIIEVKPITEQSIQPASIDCRLDNHFLTVEDKQMETITLDTEIKYREIETNTITISPHSFILATTLEYIKLPTNISAFVEGRSSIGRMGLFIENAGWIDAGFEGKITLELYNANSLPIKLQAGRRICQIVFCTMDQPAQIPYQGKYQGQNKAVGSRIFKDKEIKLSTGT